MNIPPPTLPTFTISEDDSNTYHLGEAAASDDQYSSDEGDCFDNFTIAQFIAIHVNLIAIVELMVNSYLKLF